MLLALTGWGRSVGPAMTSCTCALTAGIVHFGADAKLHRSGKRETKQIHGSQYKASHLQVFWRGHGGGCSATAKTMITDVKVLLDQSVTVAN